MAQLEKFIKVTQEQYNTLQAGGTVGSHTGINPNFIYLVEGGNDGGTVVEANPSEDATDVLTKLKVGETVYSTSNQVALPEFDSVPETVDDTTPMLFRVQGSLYFVDIVSEETKGYLRFSSDQPFSLTVNESASYDGLLAYSTDTTTWTEVTKGTAIPSGNNKIYLRGTDNTYCYIDAQDPEHGVFSLSGSNIKCDGNIENLLDYQTVLNGEHPVMADGGYSHMFLGCTSLTTAPELPATTLSSGCYYSMFLGCTSLTTAPELPATTLVDYCYQDMFLNCTSLTQAPTLPATTMTIGCYNGMFCGCTSLIQAPKLPATTLANGCYKYMFSGCTSLTQTPVLSSKTLAEDCYSHMFQNCTSLTTLPALPATRMSYGGYSNMFYGCISIKLSTTQTGDYTNEYRIPAGTATGTGAYTGFYNMFTNTGGTFTGTPELNVTYYTSNEVI